MASRRSVIRSTKHIPGGARPTTAPQGSMNGGPNFGQLSPLTSQIQTGGSQGPTWSYGYGGFLPRPTEDFTEGAFGPFSPILPVPVDSPADDSTPRAEPRWWQYDVGWNLPVGTPGTEGIKLADFNTLKTLADLYSVARACIQLRKDEIRGLDWDIMPTKDAAKAMRGSDKKMRDFGQRRAEAVKFFKHPDPDFFSWSTWLGAVLEEVFVFDALALLLRPKWGKGTGKGLLGSDLDCLKLIDGPSIRPLLDMHGGTPRPPAPAYQQYLYGVPRTDLMTMITGKDVENYKGLEGPDFMGDQLMYLPMTPRRWTPYGFAPIEQALIPVMSGLQKQGYQLDFFREGTVPAVYVSPGGVNSNMTPNQLRELQDALNAIAGDVAYKHKIIVLPADSHVMPQKPAEIADQFDEIVMNQVCMAFGVQPMELGITPRVSATVSPGASNQMAKASASTQERKATKPTLQYLAHIFNVILQDICQQDDMQFTFEGLEEDEDEATQTGMLIQQIGGGLRSIDEAREELGLQPWGLPETQDPGWATATGFVPLGQMTAGGDVAPGQQPNAQNPAAAQQPGQQGQAPAGGAAKPTGSQPAQAQNQQKPAPAKKPASGAGSTPGHSASQAADTESGSKNNPKGGKKSDDAEVVKLQKPLTPGDQQARREKHLAAVEATVTAELEKVVLEYKANKITAPQATDDLVAILGEGYQSIMDQGSQDAVDDGLADDAVDSTGQAATRAENQRSWLVNLLKQVALGYATNLIKNRLGSYSASLSPAYNHAYGQTVQSTGKNYTITWNLGNTEHCRLCTDRDGQTYTFDTLPGWPGDGGFGGLCYGGPNCGCWLSYSENGQTLATAGNPGRDAAVGYYGEQLATIQARRQNVLDARQDFVDSLPPGARARAMTRDQIAQELAAAENQAIRESGGYGGVSVEWTDVPAAAIAALVPSAYKAVDSELEALARHYRKGRAISTWEPRHVTAEMLASIEEDLAKGLNITQAIEVVKMLSRRVNLNGEVYDVAQEDPSVDAIYPVAAGSAGRVMPAHDVSGTETFAGRVPPIADPEVPGEAPGPTPGGAPPFWAPPEGTSSGFTATQDTRAYQQGDQDDADYPKRRGIPSTQGGGPSGGAPTGPSIGTGQSATNTPPGGMRKGDKADAVKQLFAKNFPPKAYTWIDDADWTGPVDVPLDQIDWDASKSWATAHQEGKVDKFKADIEAGKPPRPAVMVRQPGDPKYKIVDGHHRTTAYKQLDKSTAPAYVGQVAKDDDRWEETHSFQTHGGDSPANKAEKPTAAGIAVVADDSGRLLMLQRAMTDDDPAAGTWEFPGGRVEDGETTVEAAQREWEEETGTKLPDGKMAGSFVSPNGIYQTFIYRVPSETDVPIFTGRDQVVNPDDPDGDNTEALAWWDPDHLADNQAVRPEVKAGVDQLRDGLAAAKGVSPAILKIAEQIHKDGRGNPQALRNWYASGAAGQIDWGGPGDLTACHAIASRYMSSEQAWGFCQERHIQATGKPNPRDS